MNRARYAEVLRRLAANDVEFIVVGMMAGVLRGVPLLTADLDLVHRRSADNVSRLLQVLAGLDATYRHDPRRLRPGESHLMGPGHQLLVTTHGDLDCLGTVGDGQSYEDLLDRAPALSLGEGMSVRVIDLPTLIELKEKAGRPKDLAALPVLRATLSETLKRR
jgi:predicted nucleotidyltransferase